MLARSLQKQPTLWLFLLFCGFLYYQFSKDPTDTSLAGLDAFTSMDAPAKAPSKSPNIAIITFITQNPSYLHLSLKNKDRKCSGHPSNLTFLTCVSDYARRHGYDLIVDYEAHSEKGLMWWKYAMIERLIKKKNKDWDWIWWMDFDTLITNTDIKVADIVDEALANVTDPSQIDWILSHDCNGLNFGSFLVRNSERPLKFIADVIAMSADKKEDGGEPSEQDATVMLIKADPKSAARTIQIPQTKINGFPQEIACFDEEHKGWQPGMFVLHFAGAWAHVKGEDPTGQLMRKYEGDIIWGDWKEFYEQA